jgi:chromosome segregation ATPase
MKHRELTAMEEVNDDLRNRLADALRESQNAREAYAKLLNGAHYQATTELEATKDTLHQTEREFEITKSELKNTASELSAFKDAFDRAEALGEKLTTELSEARAQARAAESVSASLSEECKALREHLQEAQAKFTATSHDLNALRAVDHEKVTEMIEAMRQWLPHLCFEVGSYRPLAIVN